MARAGVHPMPDFSVGIRNGLISGEHRRRMGMAVWEFMWLVDHVTEEYQAADGEIRGKVLGGTVIKAERPAAELDISINTVQDSLKRLYLAGYIDLRREAYGYRIEVRNSKKWVRSPPDRVGEQESRRVGESSESPRLHESDSPAPLDIAVRDDIAGTHDDHDDDDSAEQAARIWRIAMGQVCRTRPGARAALEACRPVRVDENEITVALPDEMYHAELQEHMPAVRGALRMAGTRPLHLKLTESARAGP